MDRPFVVCHMLASLNGRIDGEFFSAPQTAPALKAYGELRKYYGCPATLYGTSTMLESYADGPAPALPKNNKIIPKEDYISAQGKKAENFIISIDPNGIMGFHSSILEKKGRPAAHVVQALTEQTDSSYLNYLRELGISYLFAGQKRINCTCLLKKLTQQLGIKRLMLAGGGIVNCSFLQEGLIDELSLVIAPVADPSAPHISIFEQAPFLPPQKPAAFALKEIRTIDQNCLWLRYVNGNNKNEPAG